MPDKFLCPVLRFLGLIVYSFTGHVSLAAGNQLPPTPERMQEMMSQVSGLPTENAYLVVARFPTIYEPGIV